jgi:hypothetical protein
MDRQSIVDPNHALMMVVVVVAISLNNMNLDMMKKIKIATLLICRSMTIM